ncbi:DUF1579 domain-containing protein [Dongia soli]|uniref:DUF1579 domain-containing protein n=1 Tax=Dongia soli TaxID=600628 RepID=A0ABU5EG79_9PROT|nr:DUF1579 domain-containing protein [Dongia soli]MDY0884495.1 DUF1579 domain-containing protein [Dongia soli]
MKAEPQKEHRWLDRFIGDWSFEAQALVKPGAGIVPGQSAETFRGKEHVRSLGGLWIVAEGEGEMPGGGMATTLMTLGYDSANRRYIGTWIGSMMSYLWVYDGKLDTAERMLTLDSVGPSFRTENKLAKYQDITEFRDDGVRIMTSRILLDNGTWHEFMTVQYRRGT